ncbi:MAG TPA: helix-turn-helix domain-containing protein [Solirubrobacteraceae bacterium]|nr:helix-turn-helix domain-containing protein [Solirubrobacteraceae bacterium]
MQLLIDTAMVPPPERVELWTSASAAVYHPLVIHPQRASGFCGRMWGCRLGPVGVYRVAAEANTMLRGPREIRAGDPEHLHLQVLLAGRLEGIQQGRVALMRAPGDMSLYDTSRPATLRAPGPFDLVVLRLPRSALGERAAQLQRLAAVTIPARAGVATPAGRALCRLVGGLASGTASSADQRLEQAVLELSVRVVRRGAAQAPTSDARPGAALLLEAQAQIEANLHDPRLGPERVARACGISTRYLHRLFEAEGTSVCEWIRAARLERCRRDLTDPALARRPIAAIAAAWGIDSPQRFSRMFHATYGCTARELRRRALQGAPAPPSDGARPTELSPPGTRPPSGLSPSGARPMGLSPSGGQPPELSPPGGQPPPGLSPSGTELP